MTGVEKLFFIDQGGIVWDRGSNFSKFNDRGSHRGASHGVLGQSVLTHFNVNKFAIET